MEINKNEEALKDFNKVIQLDPNEKEAYYQRALVKIKLNNLESACEDLKLAEKIGEKRATEIMKKYCKRDTHNFIK